MFSYPIPERSPYLSVYASQLASLDPLIVPTREVLSEASSLSELYPILSELGNFQIIAAFPRALDKYLEAFKFYNYEIFTYESALRSSGNEYILLTQLCAMLNYKEYFLSEIITTNPGRILFMNHLPGNYSRCRFKIARKYVNGLEYFEWYKYMRSHCHLGVKTETICEKIVEYW